MMKSLRFLASVTVAMTLVLGTIATDEGNLHCMPEQQCWPTVQEFMNFTASLKGEVLFAADKNYRFVASKIRAYQKIASSLILKYTFKPP